MCARFAKFNLFSVFRINWMLVSLTTLNSISLKIGWDASEKLALTLLSTFIKEDFLIN
jgi:hypothetical protein